ncbi:hypothetical protein F5Y16DRAFT_12922 [Xylariaceae sp. FL0255]|nr:hypothetical protein F5Y16DRAFT_12922 [Xylariaceae sp. FL0255]
MLDSLPISSLSVFLLHQLTLFPYQQKSVVDSSLTTIHWPDSSSRRQVVCSGLGRPLLFFFAIIIFPSCVRACFCCNLLPKKGTRDATTTNNNIECMSLCFYHQTTTTTTTTTAPTTRRILTQQPSPLTVPP